MRTLLAVIAITAIASLSACLPGPGDIFGGGGGSPASVSGKWSIMLTSSHGSTNDVDLEANFSQSTGAISAAQAVILSSSPCEFGTDFIQGTVKGSTVSFTLAFGTGHPTASFSGSVSSDGLSMSGTYKLPSGDCSPSDSGTWAATKFGDSSASYSGQVVSAVTNTTITVLAAVQEDASNGLQANVTLTGGGCSMLTLTGTAIAVVAQASAPTYAALAAKYQIGGTSCGPADKGTGTLSKVVPAVISHSKETLQLHKLYRRSGSHRTPREARVYRTPYRPSIANKESPPLSLRC
jgi:hypothetical protein